MVAVADSLTDSGNGLFDGLESSLDELGQGVIPEDEDSSSSVECRGRHRPAEDEPTVFCYVVEQALEVLRFETHVVKTPSSLVQKGADRTVCRGWHDDLEGWVVAQGQYLDICSLIGVIYGTGSDGIAQRFIYSGAPIEIIGDDSDVMEFQSELLPSLSHDGIPI